MDAQDWIRLAVAYALIGWITGGVMVWTRKATPQNIFPRLIVALFLWWLLWLGVLWGLFCRLTLWVFHPDQGALSLVRDMTRDATHLGETPPSAPTPAPKT